MADVLVSLEFIPTLQATSPIPGVVAQQYVSSNVAISEIHIQSPLPVVAVVVNTRVTVGTSSFVLEIASEGSPTVAIIVKPIEETALRYRRSAWQARLGSRMDKIRRKLIDNSTLLTAHPTDMIRVKAKKDPRTFDLISRTVEAVEIMPIILPTLKDVPMRRLVRESQEILTLDILEKKPFEVYAPLQVRLERDDLLFRIIWDPLVRDPYVMVLQVKDELGTIGYTSLIHAKYNVAFYDERIPTTVVEKVMAAVEKREALTW